MPRKKRCEDCDRLSSDVAHYAWALRDIYDESVIWHTRWQGQPRMGISRLLSPSGGILITIQAANTGVDVVLLEPWMRYVNEHVSWSSSDDKDTQREKQFLRSVAEWAHTQVLEARGLPCKPSQP